MIEDAGGQVKIRYSFVLCHIFRTFATFKTLKLLFKEKTLYEIGH